MDHFQNSTPGYIKLNNFYDNSGKKLNYAK